MNENREPWQDELDAEHDEDAMADIEAIAGQARLKAEIQSAGGKDYRAVLAQHAQRLKIHADQPHLATDLPKGYFQKSEDLKKMKAAGQKAYDAAMKANVGNWEDIAFLQEE